MSSLLALLIVVLPPQGGAAPDRASALAGAAVDERHALELGAESFALEPELAWIGFTRPGGAPVVRNLATGREIEPPRAARCVAFRPGHAEAWFGLAEGGIFVAPLVGEAAGGRLPLRIEGAVDEIVFGSDGGQFAWHCSATGVLSVSAAIAVIEELREQAHWSAPRTFEGCERTTMGRSGFAPFGFSADGRYLAYTRRANSGPAEPGESDDRGRVFDLRKERVAATFRPYLSHAARGFAFADSTLVYARRDGASDWSLRSIDLATPDVHAPIALDLRGGHFVDLFIDPSGRWLVEGDFEERAPHVYDLAEFERVSQLHDLAGQFVGFDVAAAGAEPLLFIRAKGGTAFGVFDVQGRTRVANLGQLARSLPEGARVTRVESTRDGRRVVAAFRHVDPGTNSSRRGLRVLAVGD